MTRAKAAPTDPGADAEEGDAPQGGDAQDGAVTRRPGFLIRRLHQIHTALFAEEMGEDRITPIMYSVLSTLAQRGVTEQSVLAAAVAIEKANMADLMERMRRRGYVRRRISTRDRRVRLCSLTPEGAATLARVDAGAQRAHDRTLDGLDDGDRASFVALMRRLVDLHEAGDGDG